VTSSSPTRILGIAGPSAAGKSTFARAVQAAIAPMDSALISHDDYYRDLSHLPLAERAKQNFDDPQALETELLVRHLDALRQGEAIEKPVYDFTQHRRREESEPVAPAAVIIVEGILALADERLRACFDLSVYVGAPLDTCLERRLLRDVRERGRDMQSVIGQWMASVRPMHERFVLPSRAYADTIVTEADWDRCVGRVAGALLAETK
jgi:uridine kinase